MENGEGGQWMRWNGGHSIRDTFNILKISQSPSNSDVSKLNFTIYYSYEASTASLSNNMTPHFFVFEMQTNFS